MCSHILHNICEKLVGTWGWVGMISQSQNVTSGQARTLAFGFLWCSLENLYFQYDEIISTSKLPFHNPLVMNITTFKAYFSLDYEKCPFT